MFWNRKKQNDNGIEFVIAGLGNPGREYETTRHNMGFMVIDILADKTGIDVKKLKHKALYGTGTIDGHKVMLVKPQTYMNESGRAVAAIARFYKIPTENIIIMFDDITQAVGKIRIRRGGTHGGHNGIRDIIELMGTDDIKRIKIGVSERPDRNYDLKDWVLGKIPKEQRADLEKALEKAANAAEETILHGIDSAMNKYNG
mgnify:CR=1 FL=1